jgi:hypothetical protein
MTSHDHLPLAFHRIEAHRVSEQARIGTLPRHFNSRMMTVEHKIYQFMGEFVTDYKGALWHFYELSNGGFYMAPNIGSVQFRVHTNDFSGEMSADAAGITVCLFAFSHLSFQFPHNEVFSLHFHRLREFALAHVESVSIMAAID